MSGLNASMGSAIDDVLDAGFAKLQGKNFNYIMQSYEITMGRSTKKEKVDLGAVCPLDLNALARDKDVSGRHAHIFYDFQHHSFALEILGQRGCYVRKVLHRPGDGPIKLKTQRLFTVPINMSSAELNTGPIKVQPLGIPNEHGTLSLLRTYAISISLLYYILSRILEIRMADKDEDNLRLLLKEENDLISCVATMVSNHCNASGRQWMHVEQLHAELIEHFSTIWSHSKVQKYLPPEDGSLTGKAETPWHRLLELLKNFPEKFIMSSMSRGTITLEFVSLVCLAHKFCCPEVSQLIARSKN
ncbi:hypothetical protein VPH35_084148 [Triticum aestivum]